VASQRGSSGYRLARPAERSHRRVVRLIDGPLPRSAASRRRVRAVHLPHEAHCGLRMLMVDVRNAIADILDRYTLADVVEITLRKMRRDSVSLPLRGGRERRPLARIPPAWPPAARAQGRAPAGPHAPSEGVLHHILGEYAI